MGFLRSFGYTRNGMSFVMLAVAAQEPALAIEDFTMAVQANDFSFTEVYDDLTYRLSDYRGKVVLIEHRSLPETKH